MAEISAIDRYVIDRVRERRMELNISQAELSFRLGKSDKYISRFESYSSGKHYNIEILNEIAKVLDCSPRDFWPEKAL
ncbi:helix-turn-helix domain-containing protein [Chitinophaga rhizophila]|uniref:Helix-turn-helix transcriptional regulator n=1 Tax=Chitinophaga rhizophila TaxID=2866212 RepID=A0ABS7GJI0_9BACT|nr:helix-turn-helix transcriptional regulator [Chitinophaga rhizophila]MBW8687275.1 helix-turn-helix transcriptional regulator [Chitinophaga rhizophila]